MPGTSGSEQLGLLTARPPVRPATLPVLDDARHRGTTFHEVPVKAILNSPATTGMGFWSLNPYVGCEFGCTYCYARETHKWVMEKTAAGALGALPPWLAFEKQILVKTSAAAVLRRTLFPARMAGTSLVIGTATDPYQPAERRFQLTRSILDALRGWRGLSLGIITKSPLILRDLDLLVELNRRHELSVNISIASVDGPLLRRIEARSPAPHTRLRALKGLVDAGIHAGLLVAPIIPGITDSKDALGAIMAAGKAAGARYVVGSALRLGPAARTRFLPHLAEEFPELAARYQQRFGHSESPGKDYIDALSRRIHALQLAYGFPTDTDMSGRRRRQGYAPRKPPIPDSAMQWNLL